MESQRRLERELNRVQEGLDLLHMSESRRKLEIELLLRERASLRSSLKHLKKQNRKGA